MSISKLKRLLATAVLYYNVGVKGAPLLRYYRMLRYFWLSSVRGKVVPWVMELSLTYRCQCSCVHCSASKYAALGKRELTTDEVKNILDQTAALGIPKVDFFGGEPTIRRDIVELTAYGAAKGLYMSFTTNAWLVDADFIRRCKKAGIACINVSIDSADPAQHDGLRGVSGLFDRAAKAIRLCKEHAIACIVSTYVTRERIKGFGTPFDTSDLTRILDISRELGATGVRILFPIISGKWEEAKEMEFTDAEKKLVIDNVDPSFAFVEGAYSVVKGKKVCQALSSKMFSITPYGDIQLCVAYPDSFGNIRDKPLTALLADMYSHPTFVENKNGACCSTKDLIRMH